jgi:hypothetical protein
MKHLEELSRMRVNEAIQNGLEAQRIHRILAESGERQARPVFAPKNLLSQFSRLFFTCLPTLRKGNGEGRLVQQGEQLASDVSLLDLVDIKQVD